MTRLEVSHVDWSSRCPWMRLSIAFRFAILWPSKYIWEDEQGEVMKCSRAKVVNKVTH